MGALSALTRTVRSLVVATPVRGVRRGAGQVPRAVIAATCVCGLLLALWSTALPLGDAPDELAHADLVFHLATGAPYPKYDGRKIGAALQQLCLDTTASIRACPRPTERATATSIRPHTEANAPAKSSYLDFEAEGGDGEVGSANQMLQHPPLYYWAMSRIVRIERSVLPGSGLPPLAREFALVRLANVLLVAPLPLLAWWACRRLGLADSIGIVASLVPLAVPQLLHIGSTMNNDNLLTLLVAILTVLLAGVLRGDVSRRTAVAVGAVTGLALLTKAFALVLPIPIAAAYAVAWWRNRQRREPIVGLALAGIVTAAVGGWWYLRNIARGDGIAPSTDEERLNTSLRPAGFHTDAGRWARRFVSMLTERFWGAFGWNGVHISIAVTIAATVVLLGAMAFGLITIRRAPLEEPRTWLAQQRAPGRLDLAVLLLPAALFGAFVMSRSWTLYGRTSQFSFIQGRYLFGTIVGIALVAAVGLRRLAGRWAGVAAFAWVAVMQVEGLRRVLSAYWGARGSGPSDQLRALVAWSVWPDRWLVVGALALAGALVWVMWELAQVSRRPGTAGPSPVWSADVGATGYPNRPDAPVAEGAETGVGVTP